MAIDTAGAARVHLWPLEAAITDVIRCTECGITWAEHYSKPDCAATADRCPRPCRCPLAAHQRGT